VHVKFHYILKWGSVNFTFRCVSFPQNDSFVIRFKNRKAPIQNWLLPDLFVHNACNSASFYSCDVFPIVSASVMFYMHAYSLLFYIIFLVLLCKSLLFACQNVNKELSWTSVGVSCILVVNFLDNCQRNLTYPHSQEYNYHKLFFHWYVILRILFTIQE
jgi:hypothetical protein